MGQGLQLGAVGQNSCSVTGQGTGLARALLWLVPPPAGAGDAGEAVCCSEAEDAVVHLWLTAAGHWPLTSRGLTSFLPPSQLVPQHPTPLGISAPQLGIPGLDVPSRELLLPLSSLSSGGAGVADGEGEV